MFRDTADDGGGIVVLPVEGIHVNIPAFVSVLSGQKETAESMIDW